MNDDEYWMKIAIEEALLGMNENEVPIGAVLVKDNKLVTKAHNQPIKKNDPTAHAEIQVLRKAGKKYQNYRFPKTTLYVTLEPCTMCLGALIHARIDKVIFGAADSRSGECSKSKNLLSEKFYNHQILLTGGVLEQECKVILKSFFQFRR